MYSSKVLTTLGCVKMIDSKKLQNWCFEGDLVILNRAKVAKLERLKFYKKAQCLGLQKEPYDII